MSSPAGPPSYVDPLSFSGRSNGTFSLFSYGAMKGMNIGEVKIESIDAREVGYDNMEVVGEQPPANSIDLQEQMHSLQENMQNQYCKLDDMQKAVEDMTGLMQLLVVDKKPPAKSDNAKPAAEYDNSEDPQPADESAEAEADEVATASDLASENRILVFLNSTSKRGACKLTICKHLGIDRKIVNKVLKDMERTETIQRVNET